MSISTNKGMAPVISTALAEAIKVKLGTITLSPGPIPRARKAKYRASVPLGARVPY